MSTVRIARALAALSAAALLGGLAQAQTTYQSAVNPSGDWNNSNSWSPNGVPGVNDTVTVLSGDTITVTNSHAVANLTVAGALQIQNGGILSVDDATVASGGKIEINGTGAPYAEMIFYAGAPSPTFAINATNGLDLVDNARVTFEQNTTVSGSGSGSMRGQDDASCEIAIGNAGAASNVTLTLQIPLVGELDIIGVGRNVHTDAFLNQGLVEANAAGAITLDASLESVDDSNGAVRWKVATSGALLQLDVIATGLEGNFYVGAGSGANATFLFNEDVTTTGTLTLMSKGVLSVGGAGDVFTFSGGHSGSTCSGGSYDSPISATQTCN
jgi:hypothetical protein